MKIGDRVYIKLNNWYGRITEENKGLMHEDFPWKVKPDHTAQEYVYRESELEIVKTK